MKKLVVLLLSFVCILTLCNTAYAEESNANVEDFVTRLYKVCLDRTDIQIQKDQKGFNYWTEALENGTKTPEQVAYGFIFSQEFQNKNYNFTDFITHLYQGILGRRPDAAGFDYWLKKMINGTPRKEIFDGFVYSDEFKALCKEYNIVQQSTYHPVEVYTPAYFKQMGVLHWGGHTWTWYSQRILPGYGLWIPGRHVDEKGYVCDENDYICLASNLSYLPRYTVVDTPFGKWGKIYDTGCGYGVLDVYVDW